MSWSAGVERAIDRGIAIAEVATSGLFCASKPLQHQNR